MPTSPNTDSLFRPFKFKSLTLKNRIVMAPMTRTFSPGGIPGQNVADYYRRRAEADVGLILSEGTVIDRPASRNEAGIPFFHGEDALSGWKTVIDGVHAAGGKMGPQIWHTGATRGMSGWAPEAPVESPSGLNGPGDPNGVAMSEEDIADTIAAFASASADAKKLGFDVVELHGAHGYLIDQFFWAATNQRDDRYGGATLKHGRSLGRVEMVEGTDTGVGDIQNKLRFCWPSGEDHHLVGEKDRLAQIMGDENAGERLFGFHPVHDLPEILAGEGIKRAEWFIEDEDFRRMDQRTAQRGALFHAARKLGRALVLEPLEADKGEQSAGALFALGFRQFGRHDFERQQHILQNRPPLEQDRVLKGHADI